MKSNPNPECGLGSMYSMKTVVGNHVISACVILSPETGVGLDLMVGRGYALESRKIMARIRVGIGCTG